MRTLSAFQPKGATGLNRGLVAYWRLDDVNDSVASYTLTNTNTVAFNAGFIGNGADFGASAGHNKKLNRADGLGVDMSGALSVSFWTKIQTVPANNTEYRFVDWRSTTGTSRYIILGYQQVAGVITVFGDISGTAFTYTTTLSTVAYSHITLTCDASGNYVYYLNNTAVATGSRGTATSTNLFAIGGGVDVTTRGAAAYIDEVGIWNRALSSTEVTELYNSTNGIQLPSQSLSTKAYYPLNGNSTDYSGNSNHGTPTDITYPQGRFGQGARFNGTSSVITATDSSSLDILGSLTVSCWVNISAQIGTNVNWAFAGKTAGGSNRSWWFDYQDIAGAKTLRLNISANGTAVTTKEVSYTLPVGQWINLQAVYDTSATTTYFYVNGRLQGTPQTSSAASIFNSTASLEMGAIHGATIYFYSGLQDEVIIESRAWTAKEVETYYRKSVLNYARKSFADRILIALLQAGAFVLSGKQMTGARAIVASLLKGAFILTGKLLTVPRRWVNRTKNSSNWINSAKNSSTWTAVSKATSNWTNRNKS